MKFVSHHDLLHSFIHSVQATDTTFHTINQIKLKARKNDNHTTSKSVLSVSFFINSVNCHDMHVTPPHAPILVSPKRLSSSAYMHAIYHVGINTWKRGFKKHIFCTITTYTLQPPCQSLIKDVSRKRTSQKSPKTPRTRSFLWFVSLATRGRHLIGTTAPWWYKLHTLAQR